MSSPLSSEEEARYTAIIDGILQAADLQTISRKKIREGLEVAVQKDLSEQKDAIKQLIIDRFNAISEEKEAMSTPPSANGNVNGQTPSDDADADDADAYENSVKDEGDGEIQVSLPPAKKAKRDHSSAKRESSTEDADAKLAAKLQAQENQIARGRTTRGGNSNAKGPTKKSGGASKSAKKKRSEKRVRDSDAESDGEGTPKEKRKAGGGFSKPFILSPSLQDVCGDVQMSRPQVVKKLWEYIKANELQDPNDKRQIRCDEKLQAVFRTNKVNMFGMNKLLGNHLHAPEETA